MPASPVVAQASRALEHPMNSGEDNPAVIGIIVAVKVGIDPLQRIDIRPFLRSLFHPSIRISMYSFIVSIACLPKFWFAARATGPGSHFCWMHAQANTGPLVNMAGAHDTSFPLEPFNRVVPSGVHPKWADRSEEASSEEAYNDTPSKGEYG